MAKTYRHLNRAERDFIQFLLRQEYGVRAIARHLGRSPSTISREINGHLNKGCYESERAQGRADKVCRRPRRPRKMMVPEVAAYVKEGLQRDWSPEQIAGRMRFEYPRASILRISRQGIYDWLEADKKSGGKWYLRLRRGGRRNRTWRTRSPRRTNIAHRVGIEERPSSVESRRFFGDWEVDTVEGRLNTGRVATLVERKSLFTVMAKMDSRHAACFNTAVSERLGQDKWLPLRTMTADNGAEFAKHFELTEQLKVGFYFAEPHCAWQRGLNENTNGLIRQYIPKKTDFRVVSREQIAEIEKMLNNRPRKKLGYRTPWEVMTRYCKTSPVALVI